MDARQPNPENNPANAHRGASNYGYSGVQSDPFQPFIHADTDPSYDPPWNPQSFPSHQQSINGFNQRSNNWQQNHYQTPNSLPVSNFTSQAASYDQTYSRGPAFNYGNFDNISPTPQTYPGLYDTDLDFNPLPLSTDPRFDYARQQGQGFQNQNETISPQALQTNSDFARPSLEESRQVGSKHDEEPPAHLLLINSSHPRPAMILRCR